MFSNLIIRYHLLLCFCLCFNTIYFGYNKHRSPERTVVTYAAPLDSIGNRSGVISSNIYLALGDSYTIGQGVDTAARFPAQTLSLLKQSGINISGIEYIATTGLSTVNLQVAIDFKHLQTTYAAITLLIGVNDQYRYRDTTNYRLHFTGLLNTAIRLAGNDTSHVFVLSIPDYRKPPFGANNLFASKQIDELNTISKNVSSAYNIAYVDITAISRRVAGDSTMLCGDDLHPSGKQYALWAQKLAAVMQKALK